MEAIKKACSFVGGQACLARLLGVTPPVVNHWVTGFRPVPIKFCAAIERLTKGTVTRRDLRPDDWHLIWPELIELAAEVQAARHE